MWLCQCCDMSVVASVDVSIRERELSCAHSIAYSTYIYVSHFLGTCIVPCKFMPL